MLRRPIETAPLVGNWLLGPILQIGPHSANPFMRTYFRTAIVPAAFLPTVFHAYTRYANWTVAYAHRFRAILTR